MLAFDCLFMMCDILNLRLIEKVYFNNIYDCMLKKNKCDLIWKIRHGAIPTGIFLNEYHCHMLLIVCL